MTTPPSPQSPQSDKRHSIPDDATEALATPLAEDSAETTLLAKGYEYVTDDSEKIPTPIDTDDDSLTLGLMQRGDVVEKLTREERRADRVAKKAAAKEAKRTEEAHRQVALAAAAEHNRLAVPQTIAQEDESRPGKVLFVGSAVLTAAAIALLAAFLLPLKDDTPRQSTVEVSPDPAAEASSVPAASSTAAPAPSYNTKAPTVTEQEGAIEEPVTPGSVFYAPSQEAHRLEEQPLESPLAEETSPEAQPEPTLEESPAAEETLTLEPRPDATTPAELVAPSHATPVDEPSRPLETTAAPQEGNATGLGRTPAADGTSQVSSAATTVP